MSATQTGGEEETKKPDIESAKIKKMTAEKQKQFEKCRERLKAFQQKRAEIKSQLAIDRKVEREAITAQTREALQAEIDAEKKEVEKFQKVATAEKPQPKVKKPSPRKRPPPPPPPSPIPEESEEEESDAENSEVPTEYSSQEEEEEVSDREPPPPRTVLRKKPLSKPLSKPIAHKNPPVPAKKRRKVVERVYYESGESSESESPTPEKPVAKMSRAKTRAFEYL